MTFGARGDGAGDDLGGIRRAYAACRAAGGGTVLFRAGRTFRTGPFELAVRARRGWPSGLGISHST
jgi:polygalacturonase